MSTTAKKPVSKFVRVAVEGATSDRRDIDRNMLEEIAATYDPNVYGARINIEHIRGLSPSSEFGAYGDVLAVKTSEVEILGVKKLALFAQVSPTEELIVLNRKRQKVYSSLEVRPDFAGTGKHYLTGLAVTDNPASLGTEMLEFAAKNPDASPFAARKEHPDDLFTAAEEFTLELEEEQEEGVVAKLRAVIAGALAKFSAQSMSEDARFAAVGEGFTQLGDAFALHVTAASAKQTASDQILAELKDQFKAMQEKYAALDNLAADPKRPLATGGSATAKTDC